MEIVGGVAAETSSAADRYGEKPSTETNSAQNNLRLRNIISLSQPLTLLAEAAIPWTEYAILRRDTTFLIASGILYPPGCDVSHRTDVRLDVLPCKAMLVVLND